MATSTDSLTLEQERILKKVEEGAGRDAARVIRELMERTDALELLIAKYVRTNGDGNGRAKHAADAQTSAKPVKGNWHDTLRFPGRCSACSEQLQPGPQPAPVLYVPAGPNRKSATYHGGCAPEGLKP